MTIFSKLLDIIYPPRCPICTDFLNGNPQVENQTAGFCPNCFREFIEITSPLCPVCGKSFAAISGEDHLCENCLRKKPHYDSLRAPYIYDGAIMDAIHKFKYGGNSSLAGPLGILLARFSRALMDNSTDFLVIPVPLHRKRLRERSFNQSLLLARHVARELEAGLDFLSLKRIKYTLPQTGLGKDERRKNVRNAFQFTNEKLETKKPVLLVDDVATTGNTLNECAKALKKVGFKEVSALVLAITVNA